MSTRLLVNIDQRDFNAMAAEEDGWTGVIPDSDDMTQLTTPTQEEEIQEWCVSGHNSAPYRKGGEGIEGSYQRKTLQ